MSNLLLTRDINKKDQQKLSAQIASRTTHLTRFFLPIVTLVGGGGALKLLHSRFELNVFYAELMISLTITLKKSHISMRLKKKKSMIRPSLRDRVLTSQLHFSQTRAYGVTMEDEVIVET